MLAVAFARWWYGAGWKLAQQKARTRMERTLASFSVPSLIQTLFSPWKRIITNPGAGIGAHFRAMIDNMVSRLVGFVIRLMVLLAAGVCLLGIGAGSLVQIALWPLAPLIVVGCVVWGLL